jgi:hypothetical protein
MTIIEVIRILRKGKYEALAVEHLGNKAYWDPMRDTFFQQYKKARYEIHKYKILNWLLKKLRIL